MTHVFQEWTLSQFLTGYSKLRRDRAWESSKFCLAGLGSREARPGRSLDLPFTYEFPISKIFFFFLFLFFFFFSFSFFAALSRVAVTSHWNQSYPGLDQRIHGNQVDPDDPNGDQLPPGLSDSAPTLASQ